MSYADGRREVVFRPPEPEEAEFLLTELLERYEEAKRSGDTHPLVLISALILDLLAIHPVADGNGRLARLATTHEMLACGYGVARHISVEQRIYESRNSYYAALHESQRGWREREHTIWPWTLYLARVVADAYDDFERRIAVESKRTGSKQDQVGDHILRDAQPEFSRRDVERALPGISQATIRLVLNELRDAGRIEVEGAGPGARWRRRPAN